MTECESMLKELEEKATRLASAAKAAKAPGASEREISDGKMIEQEYMGLHKRTKAMIDERGSDDDRKKLGEARIAVRALEPDGGPPGPPIAGRAPLEVARSRQRHSSEITGGKR